MADGHNGYHRQLGTAVTAGHMGLALASSRPTPADYESKENLRAQARAAAIVDDDEVSLVGPVPLGPGCGRNAAGGSAAAAHPYGGVGSTPGDGHPYFEGVPLAGMRARSFAGGLGASAAAGGYSAGPQACHTQSFSRQVDNHDGYVGPPIGPMATHPDGMARGAWSAASVYGGRSIARPPPVVQSQTWSASAGMAATSPVAAAQWPGRGASDSLTGSVPPIPNCRMKRRVTPAHRNR